MPPEPERLTTFNCWICGKTMSLEQCGLETRDALGYPVHKACHSSMMMEEKAKRKAARGSLAPGSWWYTRYFRRA
jgi:hypothetical protein